MTTKTNTFSFAGLELRSVTLDGQPWFVAADVCDHLGVPKGSRATTLRRLDATEKGVKIVHTPGGPQKMTVISEPGLYKLVQTSRKPQAKGFDAWVRQTVLPAIRKDDVFVAGEERLDPGSVISLLHQMLGFRSGLSGPPQGEDVRGR